MAKKIVKKQSVKSPKSNKTAAKPAKSSRPTAKKVVAKATGKDAQQKKSSKDTKSQSSAKEMAKKGQEKLKVKTGGLLETEVVQKVKAPKKGKPVKKKEEEATLEDDFLSDDVEGDEIGEYEEELKAVEEIDEETEEDSAWDLVAKENTEEEIVLTDAEGNRYCRSRDCDQIAIVDSYCRYHYLLFWKKIQIRKKILVDGKLERYVEELTSRYPDKFLEMIRRDLRTQKDFLSAIQELEIDESSSAENEMEDDAQSFIDEVRGMNETTGVDEEEF